MQASNMSVAKIKGGVREYLDNFNALDVLDIVWSGRKSMDDYQFLFSIDEFDETTFNYLQITDNLLPELEKFRMENNLNSENFEKLIFFLKSINDLEYVVFVGD